MQEFRERSRQVKHWTVDVVLMQIARNRPRQNVLAERLLSGIKRKTSGSVTHIEMYAAIHRSPDLRQHAVSVIQDAAISSAEAVRDHVAGLQHRQNIFEWRMSVSD